MTSVETSDSDLLIRRLAAGRAWKMGEPKRSAGVLECCVFSSTPAFHHSNTPPSGLLMVTILFRTAATAGGN